MQGQQKKDDGDNFHRQLCQCQIGGGEQREGNGDHPIDANAHQHGCPRVLYAGFQYLAEAGVAAYQHQRQRDGCADQWNHQLQRGHLRTEQAESALGQ